MNQELAKEIAARKAAERLEKLKQNIVELGERVMLRYGLDSSL